MECPKVSRKTDSKVSQSVYLWFLLFEHIIMSTFSPGGGRGFIPIRWNVRLKHQRLVGVHREPLEGGNLPSLPPCSVGHHDAGLCGAWLSVDPFPMLLSTESFLCDHTQPAPSDLIQVHDRKMRETPRELLWEDKV